MIRYINAPINSRPNPARRVQHNETSCRWVDHQIVRLGSTADQGEGDMDLNRSSPSPPCATLWWNPAMGYGFHMALRSRSFR